MECQKSRAIVGTVGLKPKPGNGPSGGSGLDTGERESLPRARGNSSFRQGREERKTKEHGQSEEEREREAESGRGKTGASVELRKEARCCKLRSHEGGGENRSPEPLFVQPSTRGLFSNAAWRSRQRVL